MTSETMTGEAIAGDVESVTVQDAGTGLLLMVGMIVLLGMAGILAISGF
jgi:hypothetical protein